MATFELSEPMVFSDLNKKENKESGFARQEIMLNTLKYKHFREVMKYPEKDQMHRLMLVLTGLSENDLGELTPNDAAAISRIIYMSMREYMKLGQQIIKGFDQEQEGS